MPSIRRMILGHVVSDLYNKMTCRKKLNSGILETPMKKKGLSTYDITLHGISHMIGTGIYMLPGIVAHDMAGPSVIFSFLIAGIVSIMAALCYAEINTRMLIKESRNIYAHFTLGEFCAFFVGWNIILQHVFGAASVVKAWSIYVDSLAGGAISNYTRDVVGTYRVAEMEISPDFLAGGLCLLCTMFMILGLRSSVAVNSLLTMINFAVIGLIVILGIFYADISNWNNENGGFFPYGFNGMIVGAATCFYSFIGFDSISIASEKARNPQRSTLLAIIFSMSIVTIGYMLVSGVLTLIIPFREINPTAAFPEAFLANGIPWAKYIISIGALCGMTTTLFGSLFSLPNILYTMTIDGQLFAIFGHINRRTQVPMCNFIISGLFSALIAVLFDLQYLIEFTSFGILIKYIVISMSIILLRYVPEDSEDDTSSNLLLPPTEKEDANSCCGINILSANTKMPRKSKTQRFKSYFTWLEVMLENYDTGNIVRICGYIFMMFIIMMSVFLFTTFKFEGSITNTDFLFLIYYVPLPLGSIIIIAALKQQPPTRKFQVPLVPLIPGLSTFFSINLLLSLGMIIWLRFAIWMTVGIIIYFLFGIHIWHYSKQVTNTPKYFSSTQQATSHSILMTSETEKSKKQSSSMSRVREKSDKVPVLNDKKLVH